MWNKEFKAGSKAKCRYPSCTFASDSIDQLKEHHVHCEIGLKLKIFVCVKCDFRCPERNTIVDHVINAHVNEKDSLFELDSDSEEEDDDDNEDVEDEEVEEDEDHDEKTPRKTKTGSPSTTPSLCNNRFIEKTYGLATSDLRRFKTNPTSPLIPKWLAQ